MYVSATYLYFHKPWRPHSARLSLINILLMCLVFFCTWQTDCTAGICTHYLLFFDKWLSIKQIHRQVCTYRCTFTDTHPVTAFHSSSSNPSAEALFFLSICLQVGMLIILSQGWHHQVNFEIWSNLASFDLLPPLPVYFCSTPTATLPSSSTDDILFSNDNSGRHWYKVLFILSWICHVISDSL